METQPPTPERCEYSDLEVTPGHLEFTAKEGQRYVCTNQRLSIKKAAGGGTLPPDWSLHLETHGAARFSLKARPMSGREAKKIIVSVDPREVPEGEWEGKIRITSTVEAVTITPSEIPVKLTVKAKPPPPVPPPPEPCTIEVAATLDASPWSGPLVYKLDKGEPVPIGSFVPTSHNVRGGTYTCAYVSGGPPKTAFANIIPSPVQSVSDGETIRFTLRFLKPPPPPPPPAPPPEKSWLEKLRELIKRFLKWWP